MLIRNTDSNLGASSGSLGQRVRCECLVGLDPGEPPGAGPALVWHRAQLDNRVGLGIRNDLFWTLILLRLLRVEDKDPADIINSLKSL